MLDHILFLFLGFILGILTGFLGIGGGFFITPALNIFGFKMIYAIGISFSTIVGNTLVGTIKHHRFGNVDFRLGILIGSFSLVGVELGRRLIFYLEKESLAGTYVRLTYILSLFLISIFMLKEYLKIRNLKTGREMISEEKSSFTRRLYQIRLSPKISFPRSEIDSISIWVILFLGVLIGFFSGFMGIGGGFIGLPLMIYIIGVPTVVAVGTSLITVFFTSCYGMIVFSMEGYVKWMVVLILLAGSFFGIQLGAHAARLVTSIRIRLLFALFLLFIAFSILLKQIKMVTLSSYLLVCSACSLSLVILFLLLRSLWARRSDRTN
jgi:hypothetical protein